MGTIELEVRERIDIFDEPTEVVEFFINGRNLIEVTREIGRSFATQEGKPGLAGDYIGLPPEDVFLPSRRFLGEREIYEDFEDGQGRIPVLGCGCGVVGCWPLLVKITEKENQVVWKDFRQPRRSSWNYDPLRPFVFDRAQYLAQLGRIVG